jgi:hypothetical protein
MPAFGGQAPGLGSATGRLSGVFPPIGPPEKETIADKKDDDEDDENTRVLLMKMKVAVEDMKRRKSILPSEEGEGASIKRMSLAERMSLSPKKREMEWGKALQLAKAKELEEEDEDGDAEMGGSNEDDPLDALEIHDDEPHGPAKPHTPSLKGVRELFLPPHGNVGVKTPKMDGLKAMFEREKQKTTMGTPVFEGLANLMQTPAAYLRMNPDDQPAEDEEEGEDNPMVDPQSFSGRTTPSTPTFSHIEMPSRKAVPAAGASKDVMKLDDLQATTRTGRRTRAAPSEDIPPPPAVRKTKTLKSKKAVEDDSAQVNSSNHTFLRSLIIVGECHTAQGADQKSQARRNGGSSRAGKFANRDSWSLLMNVVPC